MDVDKETMGTDAQEEEIDINISCEMEEDRALWEEHAVIYRIMHPKKLRSYIKEWIAKYWGMSGLVDFPLVNVYGRIKIEEKVRLWGEILEHVNRLNLDRVIVVKDFNSILDLDDELDGLRESSKVMEDFKDFINSIKLADMVPNNG
ncbi:hypothetical protein SUGI_0668150 [Cryptomeria japonica]|nr:hypothetical protein SUGI_0668150 [Cryptomeria japonica]